MPEKEPGRCQDHFYPARSGHWEDFAIRKAVIRFFAGRYDRRDASRKATLVSLQVSPFTFNAFKWTSDDPMTWVLLGYALRDHCQVAAVLILINCGILPPWESAEEGKKYCNVSLVRAFACLE
ncbi:hypothetical protein DFP72DRAFT_1083908 [Ephemerocybe angulata]|uniref:Uncharacterized protein n=1 Tax=Ephemerocybe angulata TaxID=980116 RepID=A0A8H6LSW3_9AGAR|nr:hypothetical protein DFP72DRAFT_1083908 [Tulosesus angulatus]